MLSWKNGRRETNGNWAKYRYENVENSTGFMPVSQRKKTSRINENSFTPDILRVINIY